MTHVLSVAEKPSVAKALAQILGGDNVQGRPGFSVYNRIFEIPNCDFKNGRCSMKITSVTGHLMEKEFDASAKSWSINPVELFHAPIKNEVKKENKDIEKTLIDLAKKCNTLLLWLDGDLEGENICYEVIAVCIKANPRMDVYRARFSALIERDIFRTLRNPERPNQVRIMLNLLDILILIIIY
jgi:DNA topoisomerase-3